MALAIKVENVGKKYRLGTINRDMLYKDIQSWWAKMRGKPDPNAKISFIHQDRIEKGDEFWALRNINLEIEEGEILGIIGRNGAGKSTLLKILSQITAPTEGKIHVKGRMASLLEVGTGFHPELTGRENIYLNGAIMGMSRKEVSKKLNEIIDFAELKEFINTPVKRYSSGMYVRLAFSVAAHLDPDILIVDEVLAVGDNEFQKKCLGKMQSVSSQGRTVLFVSHNLGMIQNFCRKSIVMQEGNIRYIGETDDAINIYQKNIISNSFKIFKPNIEKVFYFKKIKISNDNGDEKLFPNSENIKIEIDIEIKSQSDKVSFMFFLVSLQSNTRIFMIEKKINEIIVNQDSSEHKLTINIFKNALMPGNYSCEIALVDSGKYPIDHKSNAINFEVYNTNPIYSKFGKMDIGIINFDKYNLTCK